MTAPHGGAQSGAAWPLDAPALGPGTRLSVLVADEDPTAQASAQAAMPEASIAVCRNGADALWHAGRVRPQVVVLSATLPVVGPAEVAAVLTAHRESRQTIAVGVGFGEVDRAAPVIAAGAGAVVSRPYQRRELRPVLAPHLDDMKRRGWDGAVLQVGSVRLDGPAFEVTVDGRPVALGLREFELLRLLMLRADEVVSVPDIREAIWTPRGETVTRNTIAVHVRRLRAHLAGVLEIAVVRCVGYRLRMSTGGNGGRTLGGA